MTISGEVNVRQGISSEANVRHGISGDLQMPRIVGGGSITVDSELSTTSENPVQNKVITAALNEKQNIPDNEGTTGQVLTKTDQGAIWEDTNIPDSARIHKTASGNIATFDDGADDVPVKQLTVSIEPVQSGSGDPSPENLRPITGWTGANVFASGKNLLGGEALRDSVMFAMPSATDNPDERFVSFSAAGKLQYDFSTLNRLDKAFSSGSRFTFVMTFRKAGGTNGLSNMVVYYTDGTYSIIPGIPSATTKATIVFTTPAGKTVDRFSKTNQANTTQLYYDECGIFEGVLTADDFMAYQGAVISASWETEAGTVFGGTLDVPNGTLTVTHGQISSYNGETLPGAWISDRDVYTAGTTPTSGAQVVYELAEPVVYQLTPEQVETLLGVNNIWADCGTVEVTYNADATLAYEHLDQETAKKSMLARVEDGMTATQNYTTGDLLIVDDTLYVVTANIPNGGAITLGTNVMATTMAAEIAASGGGGGSSITVDSALSSTSENPVQNKVIKAALDDKAATSSVPASASISNAGVLSFANGAGTQLFSVQLPLYAGGVD